MKTIIKHTIEFTFICFFLLIIVPVRGQLLDIDTEGQLVYGKYANSGQTNVVNQIPDFSTAGYKGGGVALPEVPTVKTISPVNGDDGANIQAAIDEVSTLPIQPNGFRGALLLEKGTYQVEGQLFITTSGVVIRGEGQGIDDTRIIATGQVQRTLIEINGIGGYEQILGSERQIVDNYAPVGTNTLTLNNVSGLSVGDDIIIERTPNQQWLDDLDNMSQWGWTTSRYTIGSERKITEINGNTISLDAPLVQAIEEIYGGGNIYRYTYSGRINHVGIEYLRLESEFDSNTDESHGWVGVTFRAVENAWAKNITSQFFGYASVEVRGIPDPQPGQPNLVLKSSNSRYMTIQDCAMLDHKSQIIGARRYAFGIQSDSGQQILFQRCYANTSRHSYVTQSRLSGPNVFLDCIAEDAKNDTGPHQRHATGTLFDNIYDDENIRVQNRKGSGGGHGWAGSQTLFYRCKSPKAKIESSDITTNWAFGMESPNKSGNGPFIEITEELPRSLYLKQLEDRLGTLAVENITELEQREGRIWDILEFWKGEGLPPYQITDSDITEGLTDDSYVRDGVSNSGTNYGRANILRVKDGDTEFDRRAYLRFGIGGLDVTGTVDLQVYVDRIGAESVSTRPIEVYEVLDDGWDENTLTWNNKPVLGNLLGSYDITSADVDTFISFDVTSYVTAQKSDDEIASFALVQPSDTDGLVEFSSKEGLFPSILAVSNTNPSPDGLTADSYVRDGVANSGTNYGGANILKVKDGDTEFDRRAYLRFGVGGLDVTGTVDLQLYVDRIGAESVSTRPIEVYEVLDDGWDENTLTWNNKPVLGNLLGSYDITSADVDTFISFDVTSYVTAQKSDDEIASFALVQPSGTDGLVEFSSKEGLFPSILAVSNTDPLPDGLTDDSYVRDGVSNSGTNYGSANMLKVKDGDTEFDRRAYLRFGVGGLDVTGTVDLQVYVDRIGAESVSTRPIEVYEVLDDGWDENTLTWKNKPVLGNLLGSYDITSADVDTFISFDVTSYVTAQKSDDEIASFALVQPSGINGLVEFSSKEGGTSAQIISQPLIPLQSNLLMGLNEAKVSMKLASVYPNPVSAGSINIILNKPLVEIGYVRIYNMAGKQIGKKRAIINNETVIRYNINALDVGIYIISVTTEDSEVVDTHKLIITN